MVTAHVFGVVVQNVRKPETASAIAMGWLRDDLESVDIAEVETKVVQEGTEVTFYARLTEEQVERIKDHRSFSYFGTA